MMVQKYFKVGEDMVDTYFKMVVWYSSITSTYAKVLCQCKKLLKWHSFEPKAVILKVSL